MRISKIFNENRTIANIFYYLFRGCHSIRRKFETNRKFDWLGNKPVRFYVPYHPIPESNLYGHIEVLKKYIGYKNDLRNIHIQHGVILGKLVQKIMIDSFAPIIVTYSTKRKKIIEDKTKKKTVAIGPYIKYAKSRLSIEEFEIYKQKVGKTLLVFPAHSSADRSKIHFDIERLVKKVKEIRNLHGIKTVLINLFYSDCTKEVISFYEKEGFKVCSAGYWLSEDFLPNLRTIIELSDLTMSNRVGTHVGYSLCLGKPHYIFKQDYKEDFLGAKGNDDLLQMSGHEKDEQMDNDRIEREFLIDNFVITEGQKSIVNEFWGGDIFYSPDELYNNLSKHNS